MSFLKYKNLLLLRIEIYLSLGCLKDLLVESRKVGHFPFFITYNEITSFLTLHLGPNWVYI